MLSTTQAGSLPDSDAEADSTHDYQDLVRHPIRVDEPEEYLPFMRDPPDYSTSDNSPPLYQKAIEQVVLSPEGSFSKPEHAQMMAMVAALLDPVDRANFLMASRATYNAANRYLRRIRQCQNEDGLWVTTLVRHSRTEQQEVEKTELGYAEHEDNGLSYSIRWCLGSRDSFGDEAGGAAQSGLRCLATYAHKPKVLRLDFRGIGYLNDQMLNGIKAMDFPSLKVVGLFKCPLFSLGDFDTTIPRLENKIGCRIEFDFCDAGYGGPWNNVPKSLAMGAFIWKWKMQDMRNPNNAFIQRHLAPVSEGSSLFLMHVLYYLKPLFGSREEAKLTINRMFRTFRGDGEIELANAAHRYQKRNQLAVMARDSNHNTMFPCWHCGDTMPGVFFPKNQLKATNINETCHASMWEDAEMIGRCQMDTAYFDDWVKSAFRNVDVRPLLEISYLPPPSTGSDRVPKYRQGIPVNDYKTLRRFPSNLDPHFDQMCLRSLNGESCKAEVCHKLKAFVSILHFMCIYLLIYSISST
jgi:hypothetical protein